MSPPCKICQKPGFGVHFGVVSCRACAMFFRRKIREEKQMKKCILKCRSDLRKPCPSCRFQSCLDAGMIAKTGNQAVTVLPQLFQPGPILQSLQKGYSNLEEARKQAFGLNAKKVSERSTYTGQNHVIAIDFRLINRNFLAECVEFQKLTSENQKSLISQFIAPFHILEGTYKATEPHLVMLANGDHIDHLGLDGYYKSDCDQRNQQAFKVLKPYWDLQHKILRSALDENHLDLNEFLFLIALMLWDIDFHECQELLITTCLSQKSLITRELCDYENHRESRGQLTEDASMRVGRIMMMLQAMQKTLNMLYEGREVSQLYDFHRLHDTFYDSLSG